MKKLFSLLLVLALCLSLFPAAFAEEPAGALAPDVQEEETTPSSSQGDDTSPYTEEAEIDPDEPVGTDAPVGPEEDPSSSTDGSAQDDTGDDPDALPEEPLTDDLQDATASGDCGDSLIWTLSSTGVLTIAGSGDMWNWNFGEAPWYSNRNSITSVNILPGVTSIGDCAFDYCRNLTSVTIPAGMTSIGTYAFSDCSSLSSVTIPASVTSIGNGAFEYCSSLTSVTIPSAVTSIRDGAFANCSSLTSVTIPAGVTSIGSGAFRDCSSLSSVEIPAGVTSIGNNAFSGCSSLTSLTIPASVTTIGEGAFRLCSALEDIYFGGTCEAWKQLSVGSGHNVFTVHCSDGVIAATDPFACGDDLTWTLSSNGVLTIAGSGDMWNWNFGEAPWYSNRNSITSVNILPGVTSIGDCAFDDCWNLTSVEIPSSVTSIGDNAFCSCRRLTSVTIPEGVTSIGYNAFRYCDSLTSVTIPESVVTIGGAVFSVCTSLSDIYYGGTKGSWRQLKSHYDYYGVTVHCSDGDIIPAEEIYCGYNLLWTIDDEGILTIAGSGDMWSFENGCVVPWPESEMSAPWFERRDEIKAVRILSGVTSIGRSSFYCSYNITNVTIPSGVTRIEELSFQCCGSITRVVIPSSVQNIGYWAFDGCSELTEIRFEGSAPSFGPGVFSGVTATAYYPENDPTWTEEVRQNYGGTITWEAYALEPSHAPGDINGDGKVNTADVTLLAKYVKARGRGVEIVEGSGNVDGSEDGKITTADVALLAKYVKARGNGVVIH